MKQKQPSCPFCSFKTQKKLGNYTEKISYTPPANFPFKNTSIFECKKCNLAYVFPLPSKDKLEKYYKSSQYWENKKIDYRQQKWGKLFDKNPVLNYRIWRAIRYFHYLKKETKVLSENTKILDIGCGFAPFLFICRKNGIKNINSLEYSQEIGEFLSQEGVKNFSTSIEKFLTKDCPEKYDLIILSHVIEHLKNPFLVLEKLKEKLSDKGILYIEVPYRDDKNFPIIEGHLFFFDKKSLKLILSKKGYKINKHKYFWSPRQIHKKIKTEVFRRLNLTNKDYENDCLIFRKERNSFKKVERGDWKDYVKQKTSKDLLIALSTDDLGIICSLK